MSSLGFAVAVLLFVDLAVRIGVARIVMRHFERCPKLRAPRFRPIPDAENFAVSTDDGILIRGSVVRDRRQQPRGVLVFCHEFSGERWSFQNYCRPEVIDGFDVVCFDFANLGESDSRPGYQPLHWVTPHEVADVSAVLNHVRSQGRWRNLPMVLVGASRGANGALAAAADRTDIAGVVAIGAFSTHELAMAHFLRGIRATFAPALLYPRWHIRGTLRLAIVWSALRSKRAFLNLDRRLRKLRGLPVFAMSGDADKHVPASVARHLVKALGPSAALWMVPGGGHNHERDADPDGFDLRLRTFLLNRIAAESSISSIDEPLILADAA